MYPKTWFPFFRDTPNIKALEGFIILENKSLPEHKDIYAHNQVICTFKDIITLFIALFIICLCMIINYFVNLNLFLLILNSICVQ